ncbi:hypothetical protein B0J12DRAFT_704235 [Macrophomina phaseolina]|uniref:Zn(2)-C6 fungal-type domain-containing protein n=1 Tax=Macrophomina phaseolina TaxID=35725 RepID=A0ABQ8FWF7_9PEZI|nr:hypothetical protein B0J12DRAFT_704235 [Macrophomina phaseolina]
MPPKRSYSDDYAPSDDHSPLFPPKRRKTQERRRPTATQEWWTVPEAEWDRMQPAMKMNWTHVGRIMETEEGEPSPTACEQCVQAGVPRQCRVYTREAMRRYGFKTHVCAKCRASANVCSLNPYFKNSVGLRNNNHPTPQASPWLPDGPGPDKSDWDRFPPIHPHRQPPERHRSASPPPRRPPPHMPLPEKHPVSPDSLAARLAVLEEQMQTMRRESLHMKEENGFLRCRLAKLEALDEEDRKPPAPLTNKQSADAVETLALEESIASTLHKKQPACGQEQEQEQEQRDKAAAKAEETERLRKQQEEEEEREQRWAAELETLHQEKVALSRRVLELEKGQEVTQQIFRDMYYALDD